MSSTHYADRNGCALHGVIKVLDAIQGVVPIVHANAGCSLNGRFSANTLNGAIGRYFRSPLEQGATTLFDKHVVFGGTARLREQIKNSVKVLQGDLYVVATGCVPEIIGDDLPAMIKEAREQRFPVLGITSPGFKGNAYAGYAASLKALLLGIDDLFPKEASERTGKRVNLLGLVPEQDPFWEGDLLELEQILASVGLQSNRLLGQGQDVRSWKQARHADLSLVLSPWGHEAAAYLESQHQVPILDLGWLPVGSRDAGQLLEQLARRLELDEQLLDTAKRQLDGHQRYYLQKAATTWLSQDLQKRSVIVAPSATAVGLARFLAGTLGHPLPVVVITDDPDESRRDALQHAIHEQSPSSQVWFSSSQQQIAELLHNAEPEFIFASHLEQPTARTLHVPLLEIATPVRQSLILQRNYAGVQGALSLVEDFSAAVLQANQEAARTPIATTGVNTQLLASKIWQERRGRGSSNRSSTEPDSPAALSPIAS